MPRRLSLLMQRAMTASSTPRAPVLLQTLTHATFPAPLRFVTWPSPFTSRGQVYVPFPFDVQFPDDVEDQMPAPRVFWDAVDRQQVEWAISLEVAPDILVEVVGDSTPDVVEWSMPPVFRLTEVSLDDPMTLAGTLGIRDLATQRHIRRGYTEDWYGALARARD